MTTEQLVIEDFKDHVGTAFTVAEAGLPAVALTLEEAAPLAARFVRPGIRPPFSLIFLGPGKPVLPQSLFHLRHERLGEQAIFLVPVGKDARGVSYQALFN